MAIRRSKAALAEAAEMTGMTRPDTRDYLRRVQNLVGWAVPYTAIVQTMRKAEPIDAEQVAARIRDASPQHRSNTASRRERRAANGDAS